MERGALSLLRLVVAHNRDAARAADAEERVSAADWRASIRSIVAELWPDLRNGPTWIEAQVHAESGGNPIARSSTGAMGLMQLEPATWQEMGGGDPDDPETNLRNGVLYLRGLYARQPEGIILTDRMEWALAAYNCGPSFVSSALHRAQRDAPGLWGEWSKDKRYLFHHECYVFDQTRGRIYADYRRVWAYVDEILNYFSEHWRG
jgi:soluble lytic murein transglycosylase-like protein